MDGMEEKVNTILGNPEMMSQIMNMAQALGAGSQEKKEPLSEMETDLAPTSLDPLMLQKIAYAAQKSGIDPQQQALLKALRPYLTQQRLHKLENAMRAAKLAGIAGTFLGNGGLSFLTGR